MSQSRDKGYSEGLRHTRFNLKTGTPAPGKPRRRMVPKGRKKKRQWLEGWHMGREQAVREAPATAPDAHTTKE